jgi:nitrogen-specific signal transduction histidine kinase
MIGDRLPEGTGLGLTLAKNLIELHGGRVTLSSEPDRGSTFTIDLPIRPPTPRTPANQERSDAESPTLMSTRGGAP